MGDRDGARGGEYRRATSSEATAVTRAPHDEGDADGEHDCCDECRAHAGMEREGERGRGDGRDDEVDATVTGPRRGDAEGPLQDHDRRHREQDHGERHEAERPAERSEVFGSDRPEAKRTTPAAERPPTAIARSSDANASRQNGNGTGEQPRAVRRRLVEVLPSLERAGKWPDGRREAHQQRLEMHRQEPVVRRSRLTRACTGCTEATRPTAPPRGPLPKIVDPIDQAPVAERSPVSAGRNRPPAIDSCQRRTPASAKGLPEETTITVANPAPIARHGRSGRSSAAMSGGGGDGEPGDAGQQRHPAGGLPVEDEHVETGDDGRQRGERCASHQGPWPHQKTPAVEQVDVHQHDEEDPQHEALQRLDRPVRRTARTG